MINSVMVLLIFLMGVNLNAQQRNATIAFNKTDHDFGKFKEEDGKVSHEFVFTNTGSEPIIINRVTASCGCTATSWTKEPIVPGGKGYVKAEYNPRNRPGRFNKTVTGKHFDQLKYFIRNLFINNFCFSTLNELRFHPGHYFRLFLSDSPA